MTVLALSGFPLSALAEQPAIEILGIDIHQGMTEDEVRSLIPSAAINEDPKGPAAPDEVKIWSLSADQIEESGSIEFENGSVVSATRNWRVSGDREAYALFVFLHETLARLTVDGY
jgi:hypothetical protein